MEWEQRYMACLGNVPDLTIANMAEVSVKDVEKARRRAGIDKYDALAAPPEWLVAVGCRACGAEPGDTCRSALGTKHEVDIHQERVADAVDARVTAEILREAAGGPAALAERPWLRVVCPTCGALPGEPCEVVDAVEWGGERSFHGVRMLTARYGTAEPKAEVYALAELPSKEEIRRMESYLEVDCDQCGAPAGDFCRLDGTATREFPCPDRLHVRLREYQRKAGLLLTCTKCECLHLKSERCPDEPVPEESPDQPLEESLPEPPVIDEKTASRLPRFDDVYREGVAWLDSLAGEPPEVTAEPGLGLQYLELSQIRTDGGTQARAGMNPETVAAYMEKLGELPPVRVFRDATGGLWLVDGFHRLEAHRQAKKTQIKAVVELGERKDAVWEALGANTRHGLPLTNKDKERAVRIVLGEPAWAALSDREIARQTGCTHPFVAKLRAQVEAEAEGEVETVTTPWPLNKKEQKAWIAACTDERLLSDLLGSPTIDANNVSDASKQLRSIHEIARFDFEKVVDCHVWWCKTPDSPFWHVVGARLDALATQDA